MGRQERLVTDMTPLSIEESRALGVNSSCQRMANGEFRPRIMRDGYGYIMTIMPPDMPGGWQNSHLHRSVMETYIVQEGWIALATLKDQLVIRVYRAGAIFTTEIDDAHNVYVSSGTVIHTVKHGKIVPKDWVPCPDLDTLTQYLSEAKLLALAV